MAGGNQNLQRIRALAEVTFGADTSASIADYFEVRAHPSQPDVARTMLKDDSLRQRSWEDRLDFVGPQTADFPLKMYLAASGIPLTDASTAPVSPRTGLGNVLQSVIGGYRADKGDVAAIGSTTAVLKATVGTRFKAGGAVIVPTGAANALEMREVKSVTGDDVTLKTLTSNALATGAAIHGCETFYPEDHEYVNGSLAFLIESIQRKDVWWLRGCQAVGGFSFDLPQGDKPTIDFKMKAAGFFHDTEAGTPVAGSLGAATYTDADPSVFFKSEIIWANAGATTRTVLDTYLVSIAPAWGFEPIPSVSGLNGIAGYFPTKAEPSMSGTLLVRVDAAAPYDETAIKTELTARTKKALFIQIGNVAGYIVGISVPCVQITGVKRAVGGSLRAWEISWKALEDESATDKTTALRRAPWRIHLA